MNIEVKFGDYVFSTDAPVDSWDTDVNTKVREARKALTDGSVYKDIFLGIRRVTISGTIYKSTAELARTALNELLQALNKGEQYLTLFNDRRIYAVARNPSHNYKAGLKFISYSVDFYCGSPYWEKVSQTIPAATTIDSSPKEFIINNPGNENTFPIITITADRTITGLVIQNETDVPDGEDEGLKFEYQDPAFFDKGVVIINCATGTAYRSTTNTIRYFTGAFLKLLPGNNTITYTGNTDGATTVNFAFSERFL